MSTVSALDCAARLAGRDAAHLADIVAEYCVVREQLARATSLGAPLPLPELWGVGEQLRMLLYLTIRLRQPERVLETGIGNGASSFVILSALEANAQGRLVSVDIIERCGALVTDALGTRWDKRILDGRRPNAALREVLREFGPLDAYLHDADHRYLGQRLEYETVWPCLRTGGVMITDDVDCSQAFIEFVRRVGIRPLVLLEPQKAAGVLVKVAHDRQSAMLV